MTGDEFRSILKTIGLSEAELSRRLGVALSTVNRWATGRIPVPGYAHAYVARILSEFSAAAEPEAKIRAAIAQDLREMAQRIEDGKPIKFWDESKEETE